ncbi:ferredoxin--NADP reductase, putative [Plasmodium ovale wallikeri]|uniref:ferredoxin--NADP(+) reductase n=2 Tax=Plasmodium ovale TaxID=36330 RepID=A0A1C3KU54_PLAOA|nr:ferredoxin--NADP reductase, putative [Plasmodium ovale wallikeri]SBT77695.1 ferredoxin--NADP reductase, putative [Plasmodium ovale]
MKLKFVFSLSVVLGGALSKKVGLVPNYATLKNIKNRAHKKFLFLKKNTHKKISNFQNWSFREVQSGEVRSGEASSCTNLYTIKKPLKCKVVGKVKLVRQNALHEVYNIEIDHYGLFKYVEGQSCGVIPHYVECNGEEDKYVQGEARTESTFVDDGKGTNVKKKKCSRLYSISSSNSHNLSIAVKIHKYEDNENEDNENEDENSNNGMQTKWKYGYCSGFIYNIKENDDIYLTGSHGNFTLPKDVIQKNINLILIATGTGISPYIAFLKKILGYQTCHMQKISPYNGRIQLYYGVYNEDSILYLNELEYFKKLYPNNLHVHYVFSANKSLDGSSFHVQDEIFKRKDEFLHLFDHHKAELYICGHKPIKSKVFDILKSSGMFSAEGKKRVHVEVY